MKVEVRVRVNKEEGALDEVRLTSDDPFINIGFTMEDSGLESGLHSFELSPIDEWSNADNASSDTETA